ncbi:hypothetical protein EMPS_04438 [Entomortierella parvispora]|uniref:Ubiquitin-like protease family profile domain-containing protein n=1 Tax=Entomortierella parvispora TaxID=205924 RepID=A0A9P3H8H5_9FUNG|nr:hypothetical protein EMPS_04438 [Entomortierella parvispora]
MSLPESHVNGSLELLDDADLLEFWWQRHLTGWELIHMEFPPVLTKVTPTFFTNEERLATYFDELQVTLSDLSINRPIPHPASVAAAIELISNDSRPGVVLIGKVGFVSFPALQAMKQIHDLMDMSALLRDMLTWLNGPVKIGAEVVRKMRSILLQSPNILGHGFKAYNGTVTSITDLLQLRHEEWLSGQVIDAVMKEFAAQTSGDDIFVPSTALRINLNVHEREQQKKQWDYIKTAILHCAIAERKAFAIVNIGRHWAPVVIDFAAKRTSFGHSLDGGQSDKLGEEVGRTIARMLKHCMVPEYTAFKKVHELEVPQQGIDGGSCGVIALNVIESECRPFHLIKAWTVATSKNHRLWYMYVLTGQDWTNKGVSSLFIEDPTPPDQSQQSPFIIRKSHGITQVTHNTAIKRRDERVADRVVNIASDIPVVQGKGGDHDIPVIEEKEKEKREGTPDILDAQDGEDLYIYYDRYLLSDNRFHCPSEDYDDDLDDNDHDYDDRDLEGNLYSNYESPCGGEADAREDEREPWYEEESDCEDHQDSKNFQDTEHERVFVPIEKVRCTKKKKKKKKEELCLMLFCHF